MQPGCIELSGIMNGLPVAHGDMNVCRTVVVQVDREPEVVFAGRSLERYPVAVFLMGKSAAGLAFYAYVIPFLVSTAGGAVISGVLIYSLKKANILAGMQEAMGQ